MARFDTNTGGFVARRTEPFVRAFDRITRDTSTYYVLGYAPVMRRLDGSLRTIEVRSTVPGVGVRAHKGYLATLLPPPAARK